MVTVKVCMPSCHCTAVIVDKCSMLCSFVYDVSVVSVRCEDHKLHQQEHVLPSAYQTIKNLTGTPVVTSRNRFLNMVWKHDDAA